jgi:hypothetical protein
MWTAHLNGAENGRVLWSVLMFQSWLQHAGQLASAPMADAGRQKIVAH